jgi:hypothetical protein
LESEIVDIGDVYLIGELEQSVVVNRPFWIGLIVQVLECEGIGSEGYADIGVELVHVQDSDGLEGGSHKGGGLE